MINLAQIFSKVAFKILVKVDLPDRGSNQHELNATGKMREFFGSERLENLSIAWYYFADDQDILSDTATITYYDARENHPTRTEWRLYYSGSFFDYVEIGDSLVLAKSGDSLFGIVFQQGSTWYNVAKKLFNFGFI